MYEKGVRGRTDFFFFCDVFLLFVLMYLDIFFTTSEGSRDTRMFFHRLLGVKNKNHNDPNNDASNIDYFSFC